MKLHKALMSIVAVLFLTATYPVNAVPNREVDKDYLRKAKLPIVWHKTFIPFERRGDIWETVLKWFEAETGTKIIRHYPWPNGTFTFINPRDSSGKMRLYSLVEVFDIINEILQGSTKHTLLRNGNILTLIPADEGRHWEVPRVEPADLADRGKTEIVITTIDLNNLGPDTDLVAGQVKKLLGEFGHITPIGNGRYSMRGTVQSLMLAFEVWVVGHH